MTWKPNSQWRKNVGKNGAREPSVFYSCLYSIFIIGTVYFRKLKDCTYIYSICFLIKYDFFPSKPVIQIAYVLLPPQPFISARVAKVPPQWVLIVHLWVCGLCCPVDCLPPSRGCVVLWAPGSDWAHLHPSRCCRHHRCDSLHPLRDKITNFLLKRRWDKQFSESIFWTNAEKKTGKVRCTC